MDWTFKLGDLAIVFATMVGPVLAVQTQKWLERKSGIRNRRIAIFRTLMATRATWLSPAHVEALNAIPIEFHGNKQGLKKIVEAWKSYLDHLSQPAMPEQVWIDKRFDLFVDLLHTIASFLMYNFTKLEIRREVYAPKLHGDIETDHTIIRQGLVKLFKGEFAIPMDVQSFPTDPAFIQNQIALQQSLIEWLDGRQVVKVQPSEVNGEYGPRHELDRENPSGP